MRYVLKPRRANKGDANITCNTGSRYHSPANNLFYFFLKVQWFINYIIIITIIITSYYSTRIFSPSLIQGYNNIITRIINPWNYGSFSSVCWLLNTVVFKVCLSMFANIILCYYNILFATTKYYFINI